MAFRKLLSKRTEVLRVLFGLMFLGLFARLVDLHVVQARELTAKAMEIRGGKIPIRAERGSIFDRRGRILATNIRAGSVSAHPAMVKNKGMAAAILSKYTGKEPSYYIEKLHTDSKFVYLERGIDPRIATEIGKALSENKIRGVAVFDEVRRFYPDGSIAPQLVGYTDVDGNGLEGIERIADAEMQGEDGYVLAELDAGRRIIPATREATVNPVNGKNVVMTIDANIQHIAQEELAKSVKKYNAAGGTAIVMNPHNGEVLACASYPTFNLNDRKTFKPERCRNRAVSDQYEPGSTLKVITVAAALEEGAINLHSNFNCPGYMQIGKKKIRCVVHHPFTRGHGQCDPNKIITYSCNVGAAQIGRALGKAKLYEYERKFGYGSRPNSGTSEEMPGYLVRPEKWSDMQMANISFGQGISVTPLQMACAYSVIANGGEYIQPSFIRAIRGNGKASNETFKPRRHRVISEKTALALREMMINVVEEGTGESAKIEGLLVAGKTGTAQKAPYGHGKYVGSFGGFLPADDPKLVIFVTIDEPKGCHYGGVVAAPVFREIARRSLWYLKVPTTVQNKKQPAKMAGPAERDGRESAGNVHGWRLGPVSDQKEGKLGRVSSIKYSEPAPV